MTRTLEACDVEDLEQELYLELCAFGDRCDALVRAARLRTEVPHNIGIQDTLTILWKDFVRPEMSVWADTIADVHEQERDYLRQSFFHSDRQKELPL